MPLIFAIDSDKRQSAQLASLLRSHVEADLVQSASVKDGLAALRDRVPDLILTSSLLSPRDETALDKHLRKLGVAAAHVQTLTIPVMATATASKKKPAGVLAKLRREKAPSAKPSGCDPEVFASEVRGYLERAVEQREALRAALAPGAPPETSTVEPTGADTAITPAVEPPTTAPTVVMLAPTVVALVVKQAPTTEPEPVIPVIDAEAPAWIAEMPLLVDAPAAEPEAPPISVLLPEPVAESRLEEPIFSILAEPAPQEPPAAADPMADLLAVPAATVEAADQLLTATAPAVEDVAVSITEPVAAPVADPVVEAVAEPVLEAVAEPVIEAAVETIAAEPAQNDETGLAARAWTFDAETEPPLMLDQLLQLVVEPGLPIAPAPDPEPEPVPIQAVAPALEAVVAPEAPAPQELEPAEFAALLAPPPTRIADAIRMPEEGRIPTVDMGECEDLDALASRFAAPGAAEPAAEIPVVGAVVEAAAPETPVVEAVVEPEAPEPPMVEAVVDEAPAVETLVADATPVEMVFEPPPGAATPAPEAPMPVWSWLEDAVTPLADLLSNALGRGAETVAEPEAATEPEPAIELQQAMGPEPGVEPEPAVVIEEIYDPEASANWNMAAAAFSSGSADEPVVQPVEMRPQFAAEDPRGVEPIPVAEAGTFDPVSAVAWEAAAVAPSVVLDHRPVLAPVPDAEPDALPPVQLAAPEPEQGTAPVSAPVPEADVPSLDPEVLAILGMAAHRAGLDALESLESAPEPARNGDGPVGGRKKTRQERAAQSRNQRRESRADRRARRKQERPAQDEWGMFDPTQCGPDALFDVDEWTDDEDDDARRRPAQTR